MSNNRLEERLTALKNTQAVDVSDLTHTKPERNTERQSAFKFGTIRLDTGEEIQCIVQDMSENGMKVKLPGAHALTSTMRMTIKGIGFDRVVELRWQDKDEAGLTF